MATDPAHVERIRAAFDDGYGEVREQKMFGGHAWMVNGNMAVGTWDLDGLLVRVGKDGMDEALAEPHAEPTRMGERTMGGFVTVLAEGITSDAAFRAWIDRGVRFARSLPPK